VRLGMPLSTAVGTSGASALRFTAVIASALTLPSRAAGNNVTMESIKSWTWPPLTSVRAGAEPRAGVIVMLVLDTLLSSIQAPCPADPTPELDVAQSAGRSPIHVGPTAT